MTTAANPRLALVIAEKPTVTEIIHREYSHRIERRFYGESLDADYDYTIRVFEVPVAP